MDTQQIFHNLTMKFLTPHLAKANSEFHLEGPPSGITLQNSQKEIETLSLFKSKLKLKLLFFRNEIIYIHTYIYIHIYISAVSS